MIAAMAILGGFSIPDAELRCEPLRRAAGPGGQNVNKVATAVRLRFDVAGCTALPAEVRARLVRLAGRRLTAAGELVLVAQRFRTLERNRGDAPPRLEELPRLAPRPPRPRVPPRPGRAARERRLHDKRRRAESKARRRGVGEPE